jgi:hypothetical protein
LSWLGESGKRGAFTKVAVSPSSFSQRLTAANSSGPVPQQAVWAHGVVVYPSSLDHLKCLAQIHEPVRIQTFISGFPVEAFDERVLRWPPRSMKCRAAWF